MRKRFMNLEVVVPFYGMVDKRGASMLSELH